MWMMKNAPINGVHRVIHTSGRRMFSSIRNKVSGIMPASSVRILNVTSLRRFTIFSSASSNSASSPYPLDAVISLSFFRFLIITRISKTAALNIARTDIKRFRSDHATPTPSPPSGMPLFGISGSCPANGGGSSSISSIGGGSSSVGGGSSGGSYGNGVVTVVVGGLPGVCVVGGLPGGGGGGGGGGCDAGVGLFGVLALAVLWLRKR